MRVKRTSLIITFAATAEAMAAEKFCREQGLPGRLIPVPESITAGCGMAWKTGLQERERMEAAFSGAGISWEGMETAELWEWE